MNTTTSLAGPAPTDIERGSTRHTRARIDRSLKRLDAVARLMDDQFELPLIKYRVGLDPIIGLIPGGGDWVVWFVGVYIFWEAARLGAPLKLLLKMALHIAIDLLGGYAPIAGDLFDVIYKSNRRNVELLRGYFGARPELGSPLPKQLPEQVLTPVSAPARVARYGVVLGMSGLLLLLASGPIVLLYWLLQGG